MNIYLFCCCEVVAVIDEWDQLRHLILPVSKGNNILHLTLRLLSLFSCYF